MAQIFNASKIIGTLIHNDKIKTFQKILGISHDFKFVIVNLNDNYASDLREKIIFTNNLNDYYNSTYGWWEDSIGNEILETQLIIDNQQSQCILKVTHPDNGYCSNSKSILFNATDSIVKKIKKYIKNNVTGKITENVINQNPEEDSHDSEIEL